MITIVLPVSRDDYLKRVFTQLELMECDASQVSILCYVDGPQRLFEIARNLTVNSKFAQRLCVYRSKGQPNVGSVRSRRLRIANIHNEIKALINPCKYIFLIEDDTIIPINALTKLLNHYSYYPHAGLISGVQLGRWGFSHIGAWKADDVYEPNRFITMPEQETNELVKVDATGLYCCLTTWKNYMDYKFEPFENVLGPDVAFGLHLRKQGYFNYIDYSIKCDHLTKTETIKFNRPIIQVELKREEKDRWSQTQLDALV